jgi:hypothetical protein
VCVRWAIDAGAGLIKPQFVTRGPNITQLWGDFPKTSLEYLLDEQHLWKVCGWKKKVNMKEDQGMNLGNATQYVHLIVIARVVISVSRK